MDEPFYVINSSYGMPFFSETSGKCCPGNHQIFNRNRPKCYELQQIWDTRTNFMTTHYPRYTIIYNTLAKLKPTSCPPDSQCTPCFTTHLANGNQPHVHMPVNIHYELQHIWETGTNFMTTSYAMYTMIYNTFGKLKPT